MASHPIGTITIADGIVVIQRNNQLIELQEGDSIYLNDIIEAFYTINFDLIGADVLGIMYEDYIGFILDEKEKNIELIEDLSIRKGEGIYYTPLEIVKYITDNTLGLMLNETSDINDIINIKVIDPACGSGSFLIKSYDLINEHYKNYNKQLIEKLIQNSQRENNILKYTQPYEYNNDLLLDD